MRILCLADLHTVFGRVEQDRAKERWLQFTMRTVDPDVVVIAGDVHESIPDLWESVNPFEHLVGIFGDRVPVVFALGNHEMFYRTWQETLEYYARKSKGFDTVHCLDTEKHVTLKADGKPVTFVGNFLGYDGSTRTIANQVIEEWANFGWADMYIRDYAIGYLKHTKKLQDDIRGALFDAEGTTVMVTHCVPHMSLNGWVERDLAGGGNLFNAYSGLADFLETVKVDYSISGHTHARVVGTVINDCRCVNVGNDYRNPWTHHTLEV